MKKTVCLLIALILLLCGCSKTIRSDVETVFTKTENGNLISASGIEYAFLANEDTLYYLGNLEFAGSVYGEENTSTHLGVPYQTGMFAIDGAGTDNILIRYFPDDEWFAVYRKTSLSDFKISTDNCIRFEFIPGMGLPDESAIHISCGNGITDPFEISTFLSEIRMQQDPREAGLYDLIEKPDGTLENCYLYGVIYGFFEEEPNLALRMEVTSYNDMAYSINMDDNEYVLPPEWLQKLIDP